jgi:hypothetical protein
MNETLPQMDSLVKYVGNSREYLLDNRTGRVKQQRVDPHNGEVLALGVAFPGIDDLQWGAPWCWEIVSDMKTFDIEDIFSQAAGGPLAVARAEIARLEARIAELKAAVKVFESL